MALLLPLAIVVGIWWITGGDPGTPTAPVPAEPSQVASSSAP